MGATWSFTRTFVAGETLTAAKMNQIQADVQTNFTPTGMDDASANNAAMQTVVDPGESGSESLATNLLGEIQRIRNVLVEITGKTYWYETPSWEGIGANQYKFTAGVYSRPKFEYHDDDQVKVGAGQYWCDDKFCWWDAQLTTNTIDSDVGGAPTANSWYYLYLDYSDITSGTEIDNSMLIWTITAPTYSQPKRGWYSGSDKCIFAVLVDGSQNITEFYHDGDAVTFADQVDCDINNSGSGGLKDVDTTWLNVDFPSGTANLTPTFTQRAYLQFRLYHNSDANSATGYWRTDGQTGTTGHEIGRSDATDDIQDSISIAVTTSTAGVIEVKYTYSGNHQMRVYSIGWFFGSGT